MENKGFDPPNYPTISQTPATYTKNNRFKCNSLYILICYAGAVTVALIVLAIAYHMHVKGQQEINHSCTTQNNRTKNHGDWKDYTAELPDTGKGSTASVAAAEDDETHIYLNGAANKQMIRDGNGSITIIDFREGITAIYDSSTDACYLSGGLDSNLITAEELEDDIITGQSKEMKQTEGDVDNFSLGENVNDASLFLPSELQGVCAGKKTTWFHKVSSDTDDEPNEDDTQMKAAFLGRTLCVAKRLVKSCRLERDCSKSGWLFRCKWSVHCKWTAVLAVLCLVG